MCVGGCVKIFGKEPLLSDFVGYIASFVFELFCKSTVFFFNLTK